MRKIEREMLKAVKERRTWRSGNTSVSNDNGVSQVFLHNNHIASVRDIDGNVEVNLYTLRRWPTPTTKSRLRALGVNVTTLDHTTYLDGVPVA